MPKRKIRHSEKPWHPDPDRWRPLLEQGGVKTPPPLKPLKGWQLWRWDNLKDVPQE